MTNNHNFSVDYEWEVSSAAFTVTPQTGTIEPKTTVEALVRWRPVPAAPAAPAVLSSTSSAKQPAGKTGRMPAAAAGADTGSKGGAAGKHGAAVARAGDSASAEGAAAEAAPAPLVQTAAMVLHARGGGSSPQRVSLVAELPGGSLRFKEKEVAAGPVPVGEKQVLVLQIRNNGDGEGAFRVSTAHVQCGHVHSCCTASSRLVCTTFMCRNTTEFRHTH